MEIEQRIYNGDQARQVLENDAFSQAMDELKAEVTEQWQKSPVRDQDGREKLYQLLKITEKFESILRNRLETGQLARIELNHQQSIADRVKSLVGMT